MKEKETELESVHKDVERMKGEAEETAEELTVVSTVKELGSLQSKLGSEVTDLCFSVIMSCMYFPKTS